MYFLDNRCLKTQCRPRGSQNGSSYASQSRTRMGLCAPPRLFLRTTSGSTCRERQTPNCGKVRGRTELVRTMRHHCSRASGCAHSKLRLMSKVCDESRVLQLLLSYGPHLHNSRWVRGISGLGSTFCTSFMRVIMCVDKDANCFLLCDLLVNLCIVELQLMLGLVERLSVGHVLKS